MPEKSDRNIKFPVMAFQNDCVDDNMTLLDDTMNNLPAKGSQPAHRRLRDDQPNPSHGTHFILFEYLKEKLVNILNP